VEKFIGDAVMAVWGRHERLARIQPELEKLSHVADRHSEHLRKELQPELAKLVERAFG
jgi:class 3 adenylate cyclase